MTYDRPKLGIVGLGFVGSAIKDSTEYISWVLVDQDPTKGNNTYEDLMSCEGIFVCVPSPQGDDGSCDTSILESVLEKLKGFKGVIISKCTVPPQVYQRLNDQYDNLVHAPEFLTAANARIDYANGKFAIIGGKVPAYRNEAERVIKITQHGLESVKHCSIGEAALIKYSINSFLAVKVTFMNEIYQLAQLLGLDYHTIAQGITYDRRIGHSHTQVPGPDGSLGFGGMCFPKDTSALIKFSELAGAQMNVVDAAVKKNTLLRLTEPK